MITAVVRRHEVLRRLPKLLLITFGVASLVFNLIAFYERSLHPEREIMSGWVSTGVQLFVFLSGCLVLFVPEGGRRCRAWELSLPVPGRLWWSGHFLSLLAGGLALMLVYSLIPVLLFALDSTLEGPFFADMVTDWGGLLWRLWGVPVLIYLLTLGLVALWRPASAQPGQEGGWRPYLGGVLAGMAVLLVVVSRLNLALPLVAVLAVLAIRLARLGVPSALSLPEESAPDVGSPSDGDAWLAPSAGRGRRVVHWTVMRLLFKFPLNWIFLLPLTAFFGFLLGGYNPLTGDPDALRFTNVAITVYLMVSASGFFTEKLHLVDHLPVARRTLLAWLVWPSVVVLVVGYGFGQHLAADMTDGGEALAFENESDGYGLKVPPRTWRAVAGDGGPEIAAPWGETWPAQSVPVFKGLPWGFQKPYTTPETASVDFVAWQISRAVVAAYGADIPAKEIARRYLLADRQGRVTVREGGLSLEADYPELSRRSAGPVFPVLGGSVIVLYLLCLAGYFRLLRHQISVFRQRVAFWGLMAGLLLIHLGGLGLFIAQLTDDWIVSGLLLGTVQTGLGTSPGAVLGTYGVLVLLTAAAWSLALTQFRRMEPPRG